MFTKLFVAGSAVGARHAVPLQLRRPRDLSKSNECVSHLGRVCEKFGLAE